MPVRAVRRLSLPTSSHGCVEVPFLPSCLIVSRAYTSATLPPCPPAQLHHQEPQPTAFNQPTLTFLVPTTGQRECLFSRVPETATCAVLFNLNVHAVWIMCTQTHACIPCTFDVV